MLFDAWQLAQRTVFEVTAHRGCLEFLSSSQLQVLPASREHVNTGDCELELMALHAPKLSKPRCDGCF